MTDVQAPPNTPVDAVDADPRLGGVKALLDLVATLRQADRVLAQAVDIPADDLERLAPDLVRTLGMGDASIADPAAWAERVANDARVAAARLEAVLKRFAGQLVQSALGDGHVVPSAYPTAAVSFRPAGAPAGAAWHGLRYDRLPIDLRQLVPPETLPRIDGHPVLVLGIEVQPAYPMDRVRALTAELRRVDDERDQRIRDDQERERLQREHVRALARQLRDAD